MTTRRTSRELTEAADQVLSLAQHQHGVFRRTDLAAWGFDPTLALTMRRNGSWVRLHHGVYVDRRTLEAATDPTARHALLAAATVAALPGDVALFGPSAAAVRGLPVERRLIGPVHLVRPLGADSRLLRRRLSAPDRLPPAVVHILDVPAELIDHSAGLPVVTQDLAACSTAMLSSPDWAVATLDAVAWENEPGLVRLQDVADMWPRLAGAGVLRAALPHVRAGAQTPLETLSRLRLVRRGLPEPSLQVRLHDAVGLMGQVDMLFDDLGVIGEADGAVKYEDREVLLAEKRREDRLRAEGYGVVRWGWPEVMGDMKSVAAQIRAAGRASMRRRAG